MKINEWNEYIKSLCRWDDSSEIYYGSSYCSWWRNKEFDFGILICGTGIGIGIAANKVPGIRAALCSDTFSAHATRQHNDANILTMGERVVGPGLAIDIVKTFLNSSFEGDRHIKRINKITEIEKKYNK